MTPAKTLARIVAAQKREALELTMLNHLRAFGLTEGMERQFKFHAVRQWRADFAWPAQKLLLEVDGGTWTGGRHARGAGIAGDCEKQAAAVIGGWRVLRVTTDQVTTGKAVQWAKSALEVTL